MIRNLSEISEAGRTAIVDVIGKFLHLTRKGKQHTACCPFHGEKTPSFNVNASRGIYKCFGCGVGGDAITFVMEHENLSFPEAVEAVAGIVGITPEYSEGENKAEVLDRERERKQRKDAQQIALQVVLDTWRKIGLPFTEITWYSRVETKETTYDINIDGRRFSREMVQAFQLAYAPAKLGFKDMAEGLNLDVNLLKEIGIIRSGQHGDYDYFRERLIFPILNHQGKVQGFGGRKPSSDQEKKNPKYLNSPESLSYQKSHLLFGLHQAKRAFRDDATAILVEGYTDVIALHQEGINTAVASCGTALVDTQAKLLKRFTNKVLILRDGDNAGLEAAQKDVIIAIEQGLIPKVCLLPEKEDPDSFIRRVGADNFKKYLADKSEDGIIWRVMLEWDPEDEFKKIETYRMAASLLIKVQDQLLRDEYIRTLTKAKYLGSVTKRLNAAIKEMEDHEIVTKGRQLNTLQTHDAIHYGIFRAKNKYFESRDVSNGTGMEVTNFAIDPVMLIRGRQASHRLVKITNEFNDCFVADVESKIMTQFGLFRNYIEGQGNYMFNEFAQEKHWTKIRRMLYAKTPTVYPIYTMGLHSAGFYTWGNGITDINGKFWPVNENGVVKVEDTHYFIKAHAQINVDIKSDDEEDTLTDSRNFAYVTGPGCPTMKEWSSLFVETHGSNGMIALAWYLSTMYRDIIHPKFKSFPHLNGYGPPRSGKSFLGWSLQYMYGSNPKGMLSIATDTFASLPRAFAWLRNGITWFDEYNNEMDTERVEILKQAYDGKGKGKAKGSYGHEMSQSAINSAAYISGQEQMVKDNALMTRAICLKILKSERSDEQINAAKRLRDIEQTGILTQITGRLMKYRKVIEEEWFKEFDGIRSDLRHYCRAERIDVDDRVIMNNAFVLAVFAKISKYEEISFGYTELLEAMANVMKEQLIDMSQEDEAGTFWQILDFLLTDRRIAHGRDIKVEYSTCESFYATGGKYEDQMWSEPKKLIYLNFARLHGLYMEQHRKQRNKDGQQLQSLKTYLSNSDGYLGTVQKKFNGKNRRCLVFDVEELAIDFNLCEELNAAE